MNAEPTIDPATYTVYVHDSPGSFKSWSGNVIDELWVFPKDRVICINTTTRKLKITFGDGTAPDAVFGQLKIDIESENRVELIVTGSVGGKTDCNITPCVSERPAPKVVVGSGP